MQRLPALLLVAGVSAGGLMAWWLEAAVPAATAAGNAPATTVTPVLSVRRLPTALAAPIA